MEKTWQMFWPRGNTVWNTFETLSCSTWHLPVERLQRWIKSNQQGVLQPIPKEEYRLNLLTLWLVLHTCRYWIYIVAQHLNLYPPREIGGRVLRYPYYFCNILQLLVDFEIYCYGAAVATTTFCFLTTYQLRLSRYVGKRVKQLRWYRILLYIEAMLLLTRGKAKFYFKVLRRVPAMVYERYRAKFRLIVRLQTWGLRLNSLYVPLFFGTQMIEIIRHPEWNYPVLPSLFISSGYTLYYYFLFSTGFCLLLIFFVNATFILMMLETLDYQLDQWYSPGALLIQFDATLRLLTDINRFWRHKVGNYYIFLIPTIMLLLYMVLFVQMIPLMMVLLCSLVVIFGTSMHYINWKAGKIQSVAGNLYRSIYHRRIIFSKCYM